MKQYRILVEVDRNGNTMESVAVLDCKNDKVVFWEGTQDEALEFIDEHGKLACENTSAEKEIARLIKKHTKES